MTLAQDTPVVILDEPTAHLDVVSRFEFLELIEKLRTETGKTFLAVMHELPEVLRYAEQIVVLHNREIVFTVNSLRLQQMCLQQTVSMCIYLTSSIRLHS